MNQLGVCFLCCPSVVQMWCSERGVNSPVKLHGARAWWGSTASRGSGAVGINFILSLIFPVDLSVFDLFADVADPALSYKAIQYTC